MPTLPKTFCVAAFYLTFSLPATAQIIPDTTLGGESSKITGTPELLQIEGGAIRGNNLFHSFSNFSLNTGERAHFQNSPNIDNIITRVTGGNISQIDGTISANNTANLFLINPSGIIFGANAKLDIGGSFLGTTASEIKFADNTTYSTIDPQTPPLLTITAPIGLQLGTNPGNIEVMGTGNNLSYGDNFSTIRDNRPAGLEVKPGQTLTLVGGNINLTGGNLTAESGRIELAAISSNNTVTISPSADGWQLDTTTANQLQDIQLTAAASIDTSGAKGGDIHIRGNSLSMIDGSTILANTLGGETGGGIEIITHDFILLSDNNSSGYPSSLLTEINIGATGDGAPLTLDTGRLLLLNGAVISSGTFGAGNGGSITIRARESVEMRGTDKTIGLPSFLLSQANETSTGNAGTINIETGKLLVEDGGLISSSTTSNGNGGNIIVQATELVSVVGVVPVLNDSSALSTEAQNGATGTSGNLTVIAPQVQVLDRGLIQVNHTGLGNGGRLFISADKLLLNNGGRLNASTALGLGGDVTLNQRDLELRGNSEITVEALGGVGDGGNLDINADNITVIENSKITANAVGGVGGNIRIAATGIFAPDGAITASSQLGIDGNIRVSNPDVDPSQGLVEVKANSLVTANLITRSCGDYRDSQFTVTGSGGLPPNPNDMLPDEATWEDLRLPTEAGSRGAGVQGSRGDGVTVLLFM